MTSPVADPALAQALSHYAELADAQLAPLGNGLINQTYLARTPSESFVLQRLSPIFEPRIHDNIHAVTSRLRARHLPTPTLVRTRQGELCAVLGERGIWRLLTFVPGVTFDELQSAHQAYAAGQLVGRFHSALVGLEHVFVGMRQGVHDTEAHLRALDLALRDQADHRLHRDVAELGRQVCDAVRAMPVLPALAPMVGHGDLKLNNLRFAGAEPPASEQALCLLDLDTVGPVLLAYELGDAWRSWCNRSGEDAVAATFDLDAFEQSWRGYGAGLGRTLSHDERRALLLGVEWVSLELAVRFAADALRESYFGWDPSRYPSRGEHNLARARGQWQLCRAAGRARAARAQILGCAAGC